MFASRASRRRGILYGSLLAASLILLALSNTGPMRDVQRGFGFALTPIQGALSGATRGVLSVFGAIAEIDRLSQDNRTLQARNQELEVENRQLQEIQIQNDQLTKLLKVQGTLDFHTVAATVVSLQITDTEQMITLDHGTADGIKERDVVVAGGGALVGVVVDAGSDYSRVRLISDTRSTVIGLVESSRATGDVIGQLSGSLVMSDIASTERINLDDMVVTAGIDLGNGLRSPFPKGLLIGRIVDVQRDPNAVVQEAFITPAAELDKLEYVLVVTDYNAGSLAGPQPSTVPGGAATPSAPGASGAPAGASGQPSQTALPEPSLAPAP